jgi:acyl-CoA thioesterase II
MSEPNSATGSALAGLLDVLDVVPDESAPGRFTASHDDGSGRNVIEGAELLAQSIVAAGKFLPGRTVRSAHALFVAAAHPAKPLEFTVTPVRAGRMFASAIVTVSQGDRTCTTATVLLDQPQPDVIRHDHPASEPGSGPEAAHQVSRPPDAYQLRIEGTTDHNSSDEVGPPVLDAWLHYDIVPDRDDLRRALIAQFTGQLSIATTFRPHEGIGAAQAHHTVSTAVMGIGVTFHEPVEWDGWIRYHHESTYAGAGMAYARGQVLTRDGRILASFAQDAMIRAFETDGSKGTVPASSRF